MLHNPIKCTQTKFLRNFIFAVQDGEYFSHVLNSGFNRKDFTLAMCAVRTPIQTMIPT